MAPSGDRPFHLDPGDRVHFFAALFAPKGMDLTVVHRWERWERGQGWVVEDTLSVDVVGGREGGYRGVTRKGAVEPGRWQVVVTTGEGREIGRRRFRIVDGRG